ncbi:MAG TPA: cytochrome c [Isosphaeraceae bacterium]|nr:cytochrome c [Isosphaeraceae bacterium]
MDGDDFQPGSIDPKVARAVFFALLALLAGGLLGYSWFRAKPGPPPKEIEGDALLVEGREVFLDRCASCHGNAGRGDGPIAASLAGPKPRDLTRTPWKHGETVEQVRRVVVEGVQGTSMPGWQLLGPEKIRAVTAYVYYLAGKPVPAALRAKGGGRN